MSKAARSSRHSRRLSWGRSNSCETSQRTPLQPSQPVAGGMQFREPARAQPRLMGQDVHLGKLPNVVILSVQASTSTAPTEKGGPAIWSCGYSVVINRVCVPRLVRVMMCDAYAARAPAPRKSTQPGRRPRRRDRGPAPRERRNRHGKVAASSPRRRRSHRAVAASRAPLAPGRKTRARWPITRRPSRHERLTQPQEVEALAAEGNEHTAAVRHPKVRPVCSRCRSTAD